jgi:hypothetical protein
MKSYYIQHNVGKVKYLVSFHNGTSTHDDGSPFFDIRSFSNKKKLKSFTDGLEKDNYTYSL